VNVAARLQDMTKSLQCEIVFSDEVFTTAGLAPDAFPAQEVAIRGRAESMIVRTVRDARMLAGDAAEGMAKRRRAGGDAAASVVPSSARGPDPEGGRDR